MGCIQSQARIHRGAGAFTLVELMVSVAILAIILLVLFETTNTTSRIWKSSTQKVESFQEARAAFESMTRRLSQATLNTYYDYFDAAGNSAEYSAYSGTPAIYGRQSELHFVSGPGLITAPSIVQITHAVFFHAPVGYSGSSSYVNLSNAMNALGFYVSYYSDTGAGSCPPFVNTTRYRYRLMQFTQATENLQIYNTPPSNNPVTNSAWFTTGSNAVGNVTGNTPNTYLLADNIIALVILPKESPQEDPAGTALSPDYSYDSRTLWTGGGAQPLQMNQMPPLLHVTMVAIDEQSAQRICTGPTPPDLGLSKLFTKASQLDADLKRDPVSFPQLANDPSLEAALIRNRINYRIFETDIAIRGAKWSK